MILTWLKALPTLVWVILILLVCGFIYGEIKDRNGYNRAQSEYVALPVSRDTVWARDTVWLHDTHYITKAIETTLHDTVTVSNPSCEPWTIKKKLYQGDRGAVFVGDLEGVIFPLSKRFEFDIKDAWISYPKKTITETRTLPAVEHWADIFGRVSVFGEWRNGFFAHNAVTVEPGIVLHFGQLDLDIVPIGIVAMNNTSEMIHVLGGKYIFTGE